MTPLPDGILAHLDRITLQAVAFDPQNILLWDTVDEYGQKARLTDVRSFFLTLSVDTDPAFTSLLEAWRASIDKNLMGRTLPQKHRTGLVPTRLRRTSGTGDP